jgi:hypothetical protein
MKHIVTPIALGASLLMAPSLALASGASVLTDAQLDAVSAGANVHLFTQTTGQPSQTIGTPQTGSVTPGNAANASGSAFNPNGTAGTVYAGNAPQNSSNPKSVSQYDVAGFQLSHK